MLNFAIIYPKKRKLEKILLNLRKILLNLDKKIEKTWPKIAIFGNFGRNMVKKRKLDLKLRKLEILCLKLTRNW